MTKNPFDAIKFLNTAQDSAIDVTDTVPVIESADGQAYKVTMGQLQSFVLDGATIDPNFDDVTADTVTINGTGTALDVTSGNADIGGTLDVTGATTLDSKLTVNDNTGTVASFTSSGSTTALNLNNTNANAWGSNIAFQTGGTPAGYLGSIGSLIGNTDQDLAVYSTTGNGFRVYTNGNNERIRITSDGYLRMTSGSGGIQFNGDTTAANALNDYEEGTWTGTLKGGTTDPTTPVTATGEYTKIGRQVNVQIYFANVDTTGASGGVSVIGLPFAEDGTRAVATVATYLFDFDTGTSLFGDFAGTNISVLTSKDDAGWVSVLHNPGAGRFMRITGTYFV